MTKFVQRKNITVGERGIAYNFKVGETGVGEMGIGETGVGEIGVGETGTPLLEEVDR